MSAEKENSMAKQVWKGGALLAPLPAVLVTTGDMAHADVATVAWTGIVNTQPPKTYISLRKSRYSYELLEKSGECVINLTTAEMARKVDYCGIYTGRKVDKFESAASPRRRQARLPRRSSPRVRSRLNAA